MNTRGTGAGPSSQGERNERLTSKTPVCVPCKNPMTSNGQAMDHGGSQGSERLGEKWRCSKCECEVFIPS